MNNYKGENMINLRKVGLTALAGSLAAVTAQAGEFSVSGGHVTTYTTGEAYNSAQGIGSKTNVSFNGSGELDNGWSVSTFVVYNDAGSGLSSSAATMTMGDMGTVGVSKVGGFNVNGAYDETYPRAYEENSDAGGQAAANAIGSNADGNDITYIFPAIEMMGATITGGLDYSFQGGSDAANDGGGSGLDADTLDGVQGSSYLRSDTSDTFTGTLSMAGALNMGNQQIYNCNNLRFGDPGVNEGIKWDGGNEWQIYESPDNQTNASGNLQFTSGTGNGTIRMTLDTSGNLNVTGTLTATAKSFDIEHPTKEGMRLHHGVLEGPEHAVYIRGKTKGSLIQLPEYWTGLIHEDTITVQLTPIGKSSELYVKDISDNKVLVSNDTEYFYFIQAERKDVERFEVEYGDDL